MKNRATVSQRGTITIPDSIRKLAHIHPGDVIEFKTQKDKIILKHLILKHPDEEAFMNESEWQKFEKLVQKQLKKGQHTSYSNTERAKLHSRNLTRK